MIIDSHTHIYPDKIAARIAEKMKADGLDFVGGPITSSGLLSSMETAGIDISITFCVAERPETTSRSNDFLISVCDNRRLFGLGSLHPDFSDIKSEVLKMRENGIKGIKCSSLFQNFLPDDEKRMFPIYEAMGDDMVVYFHVGPPQATSERIARVLDAFPHLKVVAAHFGGHHDLEEGRKHLVGRNLYLDVSWPPTFADLGAETVMDVIRQHGTDKVLFGSDYPAARQDTEVKALLDLPLSQEEKERIIWRNADSLFGLGLAGRNEGR